MTKLRLAKLAIPSDVTAKSVGNILGCVNHTEVKAPTAPSLAQPTRVGNVHPGLLTDMKVRMLMPAKLYSVKKIIKTLLGVNFVTK